jgi:hypothetical protein
MDQQQLQACPQLQSLDQQLENQNLNRINMQLLVSAVALAAFTVQLHP